MNRKTYAPLEESRQFVISQARYLSTPRFRNNHRAIKIKNLAHNLRQQDSEIGRLKADIAALFPDAKAQDEAKQELEAKILMRVKDLHESLEQLGYKYEEKEWTMVYATSDLSRSFVEREKRKHTVEIEVFNNKMSERMESLSQQRLHEYIEEYGYSFQEGKWIAEVLIEDWKKEILNRQKFRCAGKRCNRQGLSLIEGFPPPTSKWHFKQVNANKNKGYGFHSKQQRLDYLNVAGYCEDCIEGEKTKLGTIRFQQSDFDRYHSLKDSTTTDFSSFVRKAVRRELYDMAEVRFYEEYANFFIDILRMYNTKENNEDFTDKINDFFKFYTPPYEFEEIDARSDYPNSRIADFLKGAHKEHIDYLRSTNEAGYGRYEDNFEEFKE